jgi:hypothetical protein
MPNERSIIIVEQGEVIANVLRYQLRDEPILCQSVHETSAFESLLQSHAVGLALVDVMLMARDQSRVERPFWQLLATRLNTPFPILCFTGAKSTPSDIPLFRAPPETMTIASPQDFHDAAQVIKTYLSLFDSQPLLRDALLGSFTPSIQGSFNDLNLDAILKMLELGNHTGVLLLRDGVSIGIMSCVDGQMAHAMAGSSVGKDAFCTMYTWREAQFSFYQGLRLATRSLRYVMENLVLEATRLDDEVSDIAVSIPPQSYLRRVKGYTDQLPGRRLTLDEWEVLSLVENYHYVSDLSAHSRRTHHEVMRALRTLIRESLVEILPGSFGEGALFSEKK